MNQDIFPTKVLYFPHQFADKSEMHAIRIVIDLLVNGHNFVKV